MKGKQNEPPNHQESESGERENLLRNEVKQCMATRLLQVGARGHARDEGDGQTLPIGTGLATNPRDEIHQTTNQLTIKTLSQ
jgi:hypothetical protein